ncbi:hypothetical protein CSKR_107203, partial [Clonorchis sinensis]
ANQLKLMIYLGSLPGFVWGYGTGTPFQGQLDGLLRHRQSRSTAACLANSYSAKNLSRASYFATNTLICKSIWFSRETQMNLSFTMFFNKKRAAHRPPHVSAGTIFETSQYIFIKETTHEVAENSSISWCITQTDFFPDQLALNLCD